MADQSVPAGDSLAIDLQSSVQDYCETDHYENAATIIRGLQALSVVQDCALDEPNAGPPSLRVLVDLSGLQRMALHYLQKEVDIVHREARAARREKANG